MNSRIMANLMRTVATASLLAAAGCQAPPAPPASAPPPAPPAAPAPSVYVPILPLPPKASLHDIFVRGDKVVGEPDPSTPLDPGVRILHGAPFQAKELFAALTKGGRRVPSSIGTAVRLPGGAVLTYYEDLVANGSATLVGNVEIFVKAPGVPVSLLLFHMPPPGAPACKPPAPCPMADGGGGM